MNPKLRPKSAVIKALKRVPPLSDSSSSSSDDEARRTGSSSAKALSLKAATPQAKPAPPVLNVWEELEDAYNQFVEDTGYVEIEPKESEWVDKPQHKSQNRKIWFFTLNNPQHEDFQAFKHDDFNYALVQIELGEGGTAHLQGVMRYNSGKSKASVKRLHKRMWCSPAETLAGAIKYCSKAETKIYGPVEWGERPCQGRRTDLEKIAKEVRDGKSTLTIARESPDVFVRYHRGLQLLEATLAKDRDAESYNVWLWGLSGVGKTHHPFSIHGKDNCYIKDGTQWWDNYRGQEAIIIDDYDGRWPFRDFLRLLDRYPYQGQVKGGYVKINSKFIYITCEFPPEEIYGHSDPTDESNNKLAQVLRRFTEIIEVTGVNAPPKREPVRRKI